MTNETTASQPKSIGDDAQFQELLVEYWATTGSDCKTNLIDYIDNFRAPAAQASATIQAAPDAWRYRLRGLPDEWTSTTRKLLIERMQKHEPDVWEIEPLFAATIQKPVMVAEPSAAQFKMPGETWEECSIDEEEAMLARGYKFRYLYTLAAPMVADPAGVATFQWRAFGEQDWIDFISTEEKLFSGPVWVRLAATVKAVPSEALDAGRLEFMMEREAWIAWSKDGESCRVFHRDEDGDTGPLMGWVPEGWFHDPREAIDAAMNFSAPLADKTGGGE